MLNMMNTFRKMVNDCIRTDLMHNKTSMKSLSILCYPMLKAYSIDSRYKLCTISKAVGILRNYRKALRKNYYYQTKGMGNKENPHSSEVG